MLPLLAIYAPWMSSRFAMVLACRGGTDCFDPRAWLAMKLARKQSQSGGQGDAVGEFQGAVCAYGSAGGGQDDPPMDGNRCALTNGQDQSRFADVLPTPQFAHKNSFVGTKCPKHSVEFHHSADKKMLRGRSHFHENILLVLRPERHKTLEILQHHRASSEANPLRPPMVPIQAGGEIAARRLGHFPERCFQNRGALEVRHGFRTRLPRRGAAGRFEGTVPKSSSQGASA